MTPTATRETPAVDIHEALRALSDPTRVRILHLLRKGPLCVGDLVSILGILQPKASRHLAYLHASGLTGSERRGGWTFYALATARPGFHRKLLELLDAAALELPEAARDDASLTRLVAKGGCCPEHPKGARKA